MKIEYLINIIHYCIFLILKNISIYFYKVFLSKIHKIPILQRYYKRKNIDAEKRTMDIYTNPILGVNSYFAYMYFGFALFLYGVGAFILIGNFTSFNISFLLFIGPIIVITQIILYYCILYKDKYLKYSNKFKKKSNKWKLIWCLITIIFLLFPIILIFW